MENGRRLEEIGFTWDIRPCITCSKVHKWRPDGLGPGTWADATDGHVYRTKTWKQTAIEYWRMIEDAEEAAGYKR